MKKGEFFKVVFQIIFWLSAFAISVFFRTSLYNSLETAFYTALTETLFFIFISYFNIHFLIKRFYEKKKFYTFVILAVVFILLISNLRYYTEVSITHLYGKDFTISGILGYIAKLLTSAVFLAISAAYYLIFKYVYLRNEQILLERDKLRAEMDFLKARINPHFLFNTLSNIHSLAFTKSDRTADMVLQLSDLMRYMLYECKAQMLPLPKEIEFIENYIELQQMKTPYEQKISIALNGEIQNINIEPLLFISFIENAVKYSNVQQDGWIEISFKKEDTHLSFRIRNNIDPHSQNKNGENSGFGLSNIKEQLNLLYPKKHTLEITNLEGEFLVFLKIQLQDKNYNLKS